MKRLAKTFVAYWLYIAGVATTNLVTLSIAAASSEVETLLSTPHVVGWAYFRDPTQSPFSRWFVANTAGTTYALGDNNKNHAAWVTLAAQTNSATVDLLNQRATVNSLISSLTPSNRYFTTSLVDGEPGEYVGGNEAKNWANLIAGQTIPIDWFYFRVDSTNTWYIVKASGTDSTILRLQLNAAKNDYDWQQPLDRCGAAVNSSSWTKQIYQDNGTWKVRLGSAYLATCPADTTPPQTTLGPSIVGTSGNTATLSVSINEAGTGYYLVQPNTAAPATKAAVLSGTPIYLKANVESILNIQGLVPSTAYVLYFVAKDAAFNVQPIVQAANFSTTGPLPPGYIMEGGLTWMPIKFYRSWPEANSFCAGMINGQTNWRMPTRDELVTLYNSKLMSGQGWSLFSTWSSTPGAAGSHYFVNLDSGYVDVDGDSNGDAVSCVYNGSNSNVAAALQGTPNQNMGAYEKVLTSALLRRQDGQHNTTWGLVSNSSGQDVFTSSAQTPFEPIDTMVVYVNSVAKTLSSYANVRNDGTKDASNGPFQCTSLIAQYLSLLGFHSAPYHLPNGQYVVDPSITDPNDPRFIGDLATGPNKEFFDSSKLHPPQVGSIVSMTTTNEPDVGHVAVVKGVEPASDGNSMMVTLIEENETVLGENSFAINRKILFTRLPDGAWSANYGFGCSLCSGSNLVVDWATPIKLP